LNYPDKIGEAQWAQQMSATKAVPTHNNTSISISHAPYCNTNVPLQWFYGNKRKNLKAGGK
jgi:hypothetical protein